MTQVASISVEAVSDDNLSWIWFLDKEYDTRHVSSDTKRSDSDTEVAARIKVGKSLIESSFAEEL